MNKKMNKNLSIVFQIARAIRKRLFILPYFFMTGQINWPLFASLMQKSGSADDKAGSLQACFHQIFLQDQYHARDYIKDGDVIIDAGANSGIFSLLASHLSPSGRVFAFEPIKEVIDILKKTTREKKNITPINLALGEKNTTINIGIKPTGSSESCIEGTEYFQFKKEQFSITRKVKMITLDNFINREGIGEVDFIKIDVEGYERKLLQGARETIAKYLPIISVSAYHNLDDETAIPKIIERISNSRYEHFLSNREEKDLVFIPKKFEKKKINGS